jgi:hypothetical protein
MFFQNMFDYSSPMNWNETIDNIKADIISKTHLGGITFRQNDMLDANVGNNILVLRTKRTKI